MTTRNTYDELATMHLDIHNRIVELRAKRGELLAQTPIGVSRVAPEVSKVDEEIKKLDDDFEVIRELRQTIKGKPEAPAGMPDSVPYEWSKDRSEILYNGVWRAAQRARSEAEVTHRERAKQIDNPIGDYIKAAEKNQAAWALVHKLSRELSTLNRALWIVRNAATAAPLRKTTGTYAEQVTFRMHPDIMNQMRENIVRSWERSVLDAIENPHYAMTWPGCKQVTLTTKPRTEAVWSIDFGAEPRVATMPDLSDDPADEFSDAVDETLDEVGEMLVEKNRKYGDSALNPVRVFAKSDTIEQLNVRIDDKISRMKSGQCDDDEDVERDLIGYLVMRRIARKRAKTVKPVALVSGDRVEIIGCQTASGSHGTVTHARGDGCLRVEIDGGQLRGWYRRSDLRALPKSEYPLAIFKCR